MHSLVGMHWVSYHWGCSLFHGLLSVTLTLLVRHRGLGSHSFSLASALRPLLLFLSRGPRAPSFSFSRVGLAPPLSHSLLRVRALRPLLTWALLPHPCFAQLVPYHFLLAAPLARDTPRMPKKPLVSVWLEFRYQFVWWELNDSLSEQTIVNEQTLHSRAGTLPKQWVSKLWLTNKHCMVAKLHPDWGPDLCESRRRAHSSIGVLRMSIVNILCGLPCRLESLRLKFTNEPSIFVDGDLAESIKRSASDWLGDLVP